jgi:large subunit ribosomal protein L17
MALLKSLLRALIERGHICTTEPRAKDLRSIAEKVITIAKTNDLHSRRMARRWLNDESLVKVLFDTVAPRFADRPGGYTRITRIGFRRGDAAPMVKMELTSE